MMTQENTFILYILSPIVVSHEKFKPWGDKTDKSDFSTPSPGQICLNIALHYFLCDLMWNQELFPCGGITADGG